MIVFENRLAELFDTLPLMNVNSNDYKVFFNWGTQDVLNKYLALTDIQSRYPLIWLTNSDDTYKTGTNYVRRDNVRLVLAMHSDKSDYFNPEVFNTDYEVVLNPLLDNVLKALKNSSISRMDLEYKVQRLPNYSVNDNNGSLDVWNAITLDCSIELTDNCLKPIKY